MNGRQEKKLIQGNLLLPTLEETGSFGTYAITRAGKTSFIHSFLYQLFTTNGPEEIQFVIADLKNGLDFRIFRRLSI
jgi:DNA segregation ATPase FtsK/SpoIIIE-like protein